MNLATEPTSKVSYVELVRRAKAGDSVALEELLQRCQGLASGKGLKICGNRQDAEDVKQATLLIVSTRLNSLSDNRKFFGWVSRIAANEAIRLKNKLASESDGVATFLENQRARENDRCLKTLRQVVDSHLSESEREIYYEYFVDGKGYKEIAAARLTSTSTVKRSLRRIREAVVAAVQDK